MPDPLDLASVGGGQKTTPHPHIQAQSSFASKRRVATEESPPSRILSYQASRRGSTSMGRSGSPLRPASLESTRGNSVVLHTQTSSKWLTPLGSQSQSQSPKMKKTHTTVSEEDDPFSERNAQTRLFHKIQEEIRESVERADQTLQEYDIQSPFSATTEETVEEKPTSPLPEDLSEVVPAAERFAMMQLGVHHNENMSTLVDIYNKFEDFMVGFDAPDVTSEQEVKEIFSEIYAHRQTVVTKVEAARDAARAAAEALMMPDDEPATPVEELETDDVPKDDAGPPLKEHIRHLESRINDLQEELEEEHDNYQQMEDAKDQMIKSLRSQLIESQNQMQDLVGKTAHELADSAEQVEDTRLHIAYLTLQLRSAREIAAQRVFDAEKWIARDDYEALVLEQQAMRVQVKKVQDRVGLEQKKTAEAIEYGRKCLRQSQQSEERHAAWELRLRETLKERDADLVKLNYETRLLQSRADKMLHDFDEKKKQMKSDAKDEVLKAIEAMEQQRAIFNTKLQEKDIEILQLKRKCDDMRDQMNAKALALKQLAKKKTKVEVDPHSIVETETQTDWSLLHPAGLGGDTTKSTQTGDVRGTLWRVARRRLALKALTSLDRKNKAMKTLDTALRSWQSDADAKWEASQQTMAEALAALEGRNRTLAEVTEALMTTVERLKRMRDQEPSVEEKRMRLTAALGSCMREIQPSLSGAMTDVGESLRWAARGDDAFERTASAIEREGLSADDARVFEELKTTLMHAGKVARDSIDNSSDMLTAIRDVLYGETMHHVNTARVTLEHEINVVSRGDLSRHETILSAIKSGVSIDERVSTPWMHGSAAGLDVLAGQKAESNALSDVISAWNHQRNDWVKERYKMTQENKELRAEVVKLSERVDDLLRAPAISDGSDPLAKWDDPSKMKVELEAYKTIGMEVEGPMREVAGGIVRWWERATGEAAEIAHIPHGEAPSIFRASVLLLQAACLAVRRATVLEQKPEVEEEGQQVREEEIRAALGIELQVADKGVQAEEPRPPSIVHSDKSTAMSAMSRGSSAKSSRVSSVDPAQATIEPAEPELEPAETVVEPAETVVEPAKTVIETEEPAVEESKAEVEESSTPSAARPTSQPVGMSSQRIALLKIMGRTAAHVRMLAMSHANRSDSEEEETQEAQEAEGEDNENKQSASEAESEVSSTEEAQGVETRTKSSDKVKSGGVHKARPKAGQKKKVPGGKKTASTKEGGKDAPPAAEAQTAPAAKQGQNTPAQKKQEIAGEQEAEGSARGPSATTLKRGASVHAEQAATVVQRWIRGKQDSQNRVTGEVEKQEDDKLQELVKQQVEAAAEVEAALAHQHQRRAALEKELRQSKAEAEQRRNEHEALAAQLREAEASVLALRQELEDRPTVSGEAQHHHHAAWSAGPPATPKWVPDIDWEQWQGLEGVEVPVSRASTKATDAEQEEGVEGAGVEHHGRQPALGFLQGGAREARPDTSFSEWSEIDSPISKSAAAAWMTGLAADVVQREGFTRRKSIVRKTPAEPAVEAVEAGTGAKAGKEESGGANAVATASWAVATAATAVVDATAVVHHIARPGQHAAPLIATAGAPHKQKQDPARTESGDKGTSKKESGVGEELARRESKSPRAGQRAGEALSTASVESRTGSRASAPSRTSSRPSMSRGSTARTDTRGRKETPAAPGTSGGVREATAEIGVGTEESGELTSTDIIVTISALGTFVAVDRNVAVPEGMREAEQQSEDEVSVVADILRRRYEALLLLKDKIIAELKAKVDSGEYEASAAALSESYTRELKEREKAQALGKELQNLKREMDKRDTSLAPMIEKLKTFDMLQETVASAQKEVASMGAMTSQMANELVDAREQARFHEVHAQKMQQEVQIMLSAKAELEETIAELSNTLNALPPTPDPTIQRRLPSGAPAPPQPTPRQPQEPAAAKKPRRTEKAGLGTGSVVAYHTQVSSDGAQIVVVGEEDLGGDEEVESVEQLMRRVDEEFGDLKAGRRAMLDMFATPTSTRAHRRGSTVRKLTASGPSNVPPLPIATAVDGGLRPHPPPGVGSLSQRGRRTQREAGEEERGRSGGGWREETAGGSKEDIDKLPVLFPPSLLPPTMPGPSGSRHRTPRTPR